MDLIHIKDLNFSYPSKKDIKDVLTKNSQSKLLKKEDKEVIHGNRNCSSGRH